MTPIISVCVPVYNGAAFIRECIESILSQSVADIEVIVVDNCSTDSTVEIVRSIVDPRIRLIVQTENIGVHGNIDFVIGLATGEYVKTFCADDVMLPGLLAAQLKVLSEIPHVGLVGCDAIVTDEHLNVLGMMRAEAGCNMASEVALKSVNATENLFGNPSSFMWRRSEGGGAFYDASFRYLSDFKFAAMICSRKLFCNALPAGFLYRRHASTMTEIECPLPLQWNEWALMYFQFKGSNPQTRDLLIKSVSNETLRERLICERDQDISLRRRLLVSDTLAPMRMRLGAFRRKLFPW